MMCEFDDIPCGENNVLAALDVMRTLDSVISAFKSQPRFRGGRAGEWLEKIQIFVDDQLFTIKGHLKHYSPDPDIITGLAGLMASDLTQEDALAIRDVLRAVHDRTQAPYREYQRGIWPDQHAEEGSQPAVTN